MQFECRPAVMLKIAKGAAARARTHAELVFAKVLIQQREYVELQSGDRGVVDMVGRPQASERALESGAVDASAGFPAVAEIVDRLDVDVEHVQRGAV